MTIGRVKTFRSLIDPAKGKAQVYPRFAEKAEKKDTFKRKMDAAKALNNLEKRAPDVADNRPPRDLGNPLFRNKA